MNWPYNTIVNFRCTYPGCEAKTFHQIDAKGIFRNDKGVTIWDLNTEVAIIYFPTCAYHALEQEISPETNCEPQ